MPDRLFHLANYFFTSPLIYLIAVFSMSGCKDHHGHKALYESADLQTRWSSPENQNGVAGQWRQGK